MTETPQQYTARIIGQLGERDPWEVLADTPSRLRSLVLAATADERRFTTSADRWSIAQIAAHLADAEVVGAWRFRAMLAQDGVPLQAYDQNAWASAFRYEGVSAEESVALFTALRSSLLRVLKDVDPARRQHAGHHAERGRESVEHLMRLYAGHDLNHLAQIERLMSEARSHRLPA
jgi:hypothetical protein